MVKGNKKSNVDVTPQDPGPEGPKSGEPGGIREVEVERNTKNQADGIKSLLCGCFI